MSSLSIEDLKPCPFCGTKPEIGFNDLRINTEGFITCTWFVRCIQCGTKKTEYAKYRLKTDGSFEIYSDEYDGRENVKAVWNRRGSQ